MPHPHKTVEAAMEQLLLYQLLEELYTLRDLTRATDWALLCAGYWKSLCL